MSTYRATFDRISRDHHVASLEVQGDADAIAEQIFRYAKPRVASRDITVVVDLGKMVGTIFCGFHVGGSFTLTETR